MRHKAMPTPAQAIKQSRSVKGVCMGYMNQNHADAAPYKQRKNLDR